MPDFTLTTCDPRFSPTAPLTVNGHAFMPLSSVGEGQAMEIATALTDRAVNLAKSMASVKCKNKFPVGVIGREARSHYIEARRITLGIYTRSTTPDDRASIVAYLRAEASRRTQPSLKRALEIVADGVAAQFDRSGG